MPIAISIPPIKCRIDSSIPVADDGLWFIFEDIINSFLLSIVDTLHHLQKYIEKERVSIKEFLKSIKENIKYDLKIT